jgi:hypothetical protein
LGCAVYLIALLAVGTISQQEVQVARRVICEGLAVFRNHGWTKRLLRRA